MHKYPCYLYYELKDDPNDEEALNWLEYYAKDFYDEAVKEVEKSKK